VSDSHQPECIEDVFIVAHEVHLPYRCQRLLLSQLGGPLRKAQPLAAHAHCATADNDDIVACIAAASSGM
jgi:hypothetical protein